MHPSGIAQSISITHSKLDSPIVFSCELLISKLRVQDEFQHFYFARCYPFYAVANKTRFFFKCDKKKDCTPRKLAQEAQENSSSDR